MSEPVKVAKVSAPCRAPEWALRAGLDIAVRHIPRENFEAFAALANEVAEALYNATPHLFGGPYVPAPDPAQIRLDALEAVLVITNRHAEVCADIGKTEEDGDRDQEIMSKARAHTATLIGDEVRALMDKETGV